MKINFQKFTSENGQSLAEYALVVGLMSVIVIALFMSLGPQIYDALHDAIDEDTQQKAEDQLKNELDGDTTNGN